MALVGTRVGTTLGAGMVAAGGPVALGVVPAGSAIVVEDCVAAATTVAGLGAVGCVVAAISPPAGLPPVFVTSGEAGVVSVDGAA